MASDTSIAGFVMEEMCFGGCKEFFSTITNPPLMMSCGHSFCGLCIRKFARKCPKCGLVSPETWKYPTNTLKIKASCNNEIRMFETYNVAKFKCIIEEFTSEIFQIGITLRSDVKSLLLHIKHMTEELAGYTVLLKNVNIVGVGKSNSTMEFSPAEGERGMLLVLRDYRAIRRKLAANIFEIQRLPYDDKDVSNFDFQEFAELSLEAVKRENAWVGHEINGAWAWGIVTTIHDTLLIGTLRFMKLPSNDVALLQLKWIKPIFIEVCRTVYFEFEAHDHELAKIRNTVPNFPKRFKVYIVLRSNFTSYPIANQFSYLVTGEKGASYVNAKAKVMQDYIKVDDQSKRDILKGIPDSDSNKPWNAEEGVVTCSRAIGDYSCFYLHRSDQKLKGDHINIGNVYSGLNYFHTGFKFTVKDCGIVIFKTDKIKSWSLSKVKK